MKDCLQKWSDNTFKVKKQKEGSALKLSKKGIFSLNQFVINKILVENSVSAIQHMGKRKFILRPPPLLTKLNVFFYSCSFILYTYHLKKNSLGQKDGGCQNAQKQFIIKKTLVSKLYEYQFTMPCTSM